MTEEVEQRPRSRRAVIGWFLFDWAAQPWATLITSFIFGPFFVAHLAKTPIEGQALWGYAAAGAGLLVALASPPLGAIADAGGGRKKWIATFSVFIVAASIALWFCRPGESFAVALAIVAFVIGTVATELATVFNNAMIPDVADRHQIGRLSGAGWAVGYAGGLISLLLVLGFFVANPASGKTVLGIGPLFGLDASASEGDRSTGPLAALWYVVFVVPFFLFAPDSPKQLNVLQAIRPGLCDLRENLKSLFGQKRVARFLIASMLYLDGVTALSLFGGVYGATAFHWGPVQLSILGILLIVAGIIGALVGGWLDDRLGSRRLITALLIVLTAASLAIPSVDAEHILFLIPVGTPATGGLFSSAGEWFYLLLAMVIGLTVAPLQASGRTLLVQLAPREKLTQFFGLYGLAGRVTSFLGPILVGTMTALSGSQRLGISVLALFFLAGLAVLSGVRAPEIQTGR